MSETHKDCNYVSATQGPCTKTAVWVITDLGDSFETTVWYWTCSRHRNKFDGSARRF